MLFLADIAFMSGDLTGLCLYMLNTLNTSTQLINELMILQFLFTKNYPSSQQNNTVNKNKKIFFKFTLKICLLTFPSNVANQLVCFWSRRNVIFLILFKARQTIFYFPLDTYFFKLKCFTRFDSVSFKL